jgi:hypothetical protein
MIDTIEVVTTEYFMDDPCSPITNTYYAFDNSKGEFYCYVIVDEDIPITKEWIKAHDEYYEKSKVKVEVEERDCN